MPLYEYECAGCGPFSAFRAMAEYAAPAACPKCGIEAPRAFFSLPAMIAGVSRPTAGRDAPGAGTSAFGRHGGGCRCGCGSMRIRREDWVRKLL